MSAKSRPHYSVSDYLDIEQMCNIKHEYFDGDIFAMVGASFNHNLIKDNVSRNLGNQLSDRDCYVLTSDMRVKTGSELYTYPDVVVLCGQKQIETIEGKETLINPSLIVEVLSKTTDNYDKQGKFEHYQTIASFNEYLLIDQYRYYVCLQVRQADNSWLKTEYRAIEDTIELPVINCQLTLKQIYRQVEFAA